MNDSVDCKLDGRLSVFVLVFGQCRITEGLIPWQSHISGWSRQTK